MGFYGDFLKAEMRNTAAANVQRENDMKMQHDHELAIVDKKVTALMKLSDSLNRLSAVIQPTIICVNIDKDTNPSDLKKLIESLR